MTPAQSIVDLRRPYVVGGIDMGDLIEGRPFESSTHGPSVRVVVRVDGALCSLDLDQEAAEAFCKRTMAVFHPESWEAS